MKLLPFLLPVFLACAPAVDLPAEIRCELLAVDLTTDDAATASFHVTNGTNDTVSYRGYSEDGPLYECQVLEAGAWQASPLGWCGTGTATYTLEPGESLSFSAIVPADGRSYRFFFGDPPVLTPPVLAPRK